MAILHQLGLGVCILDYRGFGGSEGTPTERGLIRDAEVGPFYVSFFALVPFLVSNCFYTAQTGNIRVLLGKNLQRLYRTTHANYSV